MLTTTIAGGIPDVNTSMNNWVKFTTIAGTDPQFCCIESDKPILVMQYSLGLRANSPTSRDGDSFLSIVPPVHQYLNNFTVTTPDFATFRFKTSIGVAVSAAFFDNSILAQGSIQVHGNALIPHDHVGWKPIYCRNRDICGYAARQEIGSAYGSFNVLHTDSHAGIYVEVTGLGQANSFGYTSGIMLENSRRKLINDIHKYIL